MNDLLTGLCLVARFRNCLAVGIWFHLHIQITGLLINRPPSLSFQKMNARKLLLGFVCNLSPVLCPELAYQAHFMGFSDLKDCKTWNLGVPSFIFHAFAWSVILSFPSSGCSTTSQKIYLKARFFINLIHEKEMFANGFPQSAFLMCCSCREIC